MMGDFSLPLQKWQKSPQPQEYYHKKKKKLVVPSENGGSKAIVKGEDATMTLQLSGEDEDIVPPQRSEAVLCAALDNVQRITAHPVTDATNRAGHHQFPNGWIFLTR